MMTVRYFVVTRYHSTLDVDIHAQNIFAHCFRIMGVCVEPYL